MGLGDKIRNAAEGAKGQGKEHLGDALDNDRMEAEGRSEQVQADVKQTGEKVKDAWNDATGN
jgi:uncharacterized protein YjbJ (UPF0337 family)